MRTNVNTEARVTPEDVARYLARCQQPRMAAAVREWEQQARVMSRQYHDLLMEATRLQMQVTPQGPTPERVSHKSEWD